MTRNVAVGWAEVKKMIGEMAHEIRLRGQVRRARRHWHDGNLYVIRDRYVGHRLAQCEYAVRNPNGSKRWVPCEEGVDFADIAPLRARRLDG